MEVEKMKKFGDKYNFEIYGYEISFLAFAIYELRRSMCNDEIIFSLANSEA